MSLAFLPTSFVMVVIPARVADHTRRRFLPRCPRRRVIDEALDVGQSIRIGQREGEVKTIDPATWT
jgi:hypothetical protein